MNPKVDDKLLDEPLDEYEDLPIGGFYATVVPADDRINMRSARPTLDDYDEDIGDDEWLGDADELRIVDHP